MQLPAPVVLICLSCICCATQSGCFTLSQLAGGRPKSGYDTTMLKAQGYYLPPGGMPSPLPDGMVPGASSIVLEIRGEEPKLAAIAISPDQPVTIEELARKAELADQLGQCSLYIMRPNGHQPPVRLDVRLNSKGKADNPARNYAVRPGDHIVVISDGRSPLERFVDRQLGRD